LEGISTWNSDWKSPSMVLALSYSSGDPARWGIVAYFREVASAISESGTELSNNQQTAFRYEVTIWHTGIAFRNELSVTSCLRDVHGGRNRPHSMA
jgi:hypothetical protein